MSEAKNKILIVEDELKIVQILEEYLIDSNFLVENVGNGSAVQKTLQQGAFDLILLDIRLPGMNGIDVCKQIRKTSNIPIIMITAQVEEIDRLLGLEIGADDYICKPFSPREVVARIKTVLKRSSPQKIGDEIIDIGHGDIVIDSKKFEILLRGKVETFTKSEFEIINAMITNKNIVFSRQQLLNVVQGSNIEGYERNIDTHIKNIRKKIKKVFPDKYKFESIYGVGYKFTY